jgi:hypothetical protein
MVTTPSNEIVSNYGMGLIVYASADTGPLHVPRVSGCVDPAYPKPTGVHPAMLILPADVQWEGLRLKADLEVKGGRYPVPWACRQKVNSDGSLTLRHNSSPEQPDQR